MRKIDSEVLLKSESYIPIEIKKESLTILDIFLTNLPFIITVFIVLASALVTYFIQRKSIEKQATQAEVTRKANHEDKISDYRHEWLQSLRETSSELIKSLYLCKSHCAEVNIFRDHEQTASRYGDLENEKAAIQKRLDSNEKFRKERAKFYLFYAKLKMFFKVEDADIEDLNKLLKKAKESLHHDKQYVDDKLIDEIVEELQRILKNEWEVTKARSWGKDSK